MRSTFLVHLKVSRPEELLRAEQELQRTKIELQTSGFSTVAGSLYLAWMRACSHAVAWAVRRLVTWAFSAMSHVPNCLADTLARA